jgi:hypothetical protein
MKKIPKQTVTTLGFLGRLWLKTVLPIKEEEEKGIHLLQNDCRGRSHSSLIIDAFHTISMILREERLSHPQS